MHHMMVIRLNILSTIERRILLFWNLQQNAFLVDLNSQNLILILNYYFYRLYNCAKKFYWKSIPNEGRLTAFSELQSAANVDLPNNIYKFHFKLYVRWEGKKT